MATEYTYLTDRQMQHIPKRGADVVTLKHQSIDGCITQRRFWPTLAGGKPVYIDATSWEHAQLQLDALRETGRVTGEVCGVVGNA